MRKVVLLLGPVVATAALFACEDSSSSSGDLGNPDAASFDDGALPDGYLSPVDAADAADAAQVKTVSVNVSRAGAPASNVMVVFHDAAGGVLETKTTDATGKATSTPGVAPAQASALLGSGNLRRILTWTAVELGDELFTSDIGTFQSEGTYAVTLQGTFADGGAAAGNASIGTCTGGAAGVSVAIDLSPACARPTMSILARALNGAQNDVLAYAFTKGKAAPVDGGTASATVGPWLGPTRVTVTPKNLDLTLENAFALLSDVSGGLAFPNELGGTIGRLGVAPFDVAPGFADAYQAAVRYNPTATLGSTILVARRVAPAANVDIDFAGAPPSINGSELDVTDVKRPKIDWTTVGNASLATTDGGSIAIEWSDARIDNHGWTFIVPPNATTVKAPSMPASAAAWVPRAAGDAGPASRLSNPDITFIESDLLPGYAELRREVGRIVPLTRLTDRESEAVLPANGTLKATSFMLVTR